MKRLLDFVISFIVILTLLPLFLLIILLIYFRLGNPVIFTQTRAGFNGNLFTLYKFRTMTQETNKFKALLPDANRLTRFGKRLRKTSLDELPSLWNVLKGDMSLVGPRPLLKEYLKYYTPEQFHRHDVKPGITGWAQVNGRNAISWEKKFILDIWYVDNESLFLYFKILTMTVLKVFTGDGVTPKDRPIMKKFNGE
jgi:sugar transferase EpsL